MDKEKPFEDVMGKLKQFEDVMGKIKPQELNATSTTKDEIEAKKQEVSLETQLHELKESIKKEEGVVVKVEFVDNRTQQISQPMPKQENVGCILLATGFFLFCLFANISVSPTWMFIIGTVIALVVLFLKGKS
jgi:hypothetical protein